MAATGNWITGLDNALSAPLHAFISQGATGLSTYLTAPLAAGVTLYVVIYGVGLMTGKISEPMGGFVSFALKLAVILLLVQNSANYDAFVTAVFLDTLPREIVGALHTGQAVEASTFDTVLDKGMEVAVTVWKSAGWSSPGATLVNGFVGVFIVAMTGMMVAVGFCVTLYVKTALSLCLALGPLFIALALFDTTRKFCDAWIGQLANFTVLQVLLQAIGTLILSTFQSLAVTAANSGTVVGGTFDVLALASGMIAYCISGAYLFQQLPILASALTSGGINLGMGGLSGGVGSGAAIGNWLTGGGTGRAANKVLKLRGRK
jgi:type IV secretion system protein VirB6